MDQQKKPGNAGKVEKEKVCPFDKKCEECLLYIEIPGFKDQRECAFIISAIK